MDGSLRWSDEDLAELSAEERAELVRRVVAIEAPAPPPPHRRRRFLVLASIGSLLLVPWIGFLAATLPHRYEARHWTLAWVGFDVALLVGLAATAYMAWRGRPAVIFPALVTATLLVCDAWFDVLTSRTTHELVVAIAMAAVAEGPLALLCIWVARNADRVGVWAHTRGRRR